MKKYTASSFVYLESLGQRKNKQKKHQYQPGQKGVDLSPQTSKCSLYFTLMLERELEIEELFTYIGISNAL